MEISAFQGRLFRGCLRLRACLRMWGLVYTASFEKHVGPMTSFGEDSSVTGGWGGGLGWSK